MPAVELFTLNYPRFQPDMGVPVRTSNGFPRYVRYPLTASMPGIMPERHTIKWTDRERFWTHYSRKLNSIGVDDLRGAFQTIADTFGDHRLVLMCYEDISTPGKWCHRQMFAQWWIAMTGEPVIELGPKPEAPLASLFD
jgi:hypothetical protein